jgi:hypothetical protein
MGKLATVVKTEHVHAVRDVPVLWKTALAVKLVSVHVAQDVIVLDQVMVLMGCLVIR